MTRARRWLFAALFLLAGIVLVTWATRAAWLAFSAYSDFWADQELCERTGPDLDAQIAACTRQIGSGHFWGHDLAIEHYNRGITWKAKGDLDRAIADYTEAIRLDPKYERAYHNRGNAWSDKGDLDRAIADYDQALQRDPKDAAPYNNRGIAWKAKGDLDRAIADYTEAIRLDPKDSDPYNNRGLAWKAKGDFDRAIADLTEAIRLDPKYERAYVNRGIAWSDKGDLDRAIADLTEAIRLDPANADYFNSRCWGRALVGKDLNGALADCNESLRLRPDDANALNSRGLVQFKLGAFDAAIADYSAAVAQNANDADSLYARGAAKLKKGDTAAGNADIAAAKAIKPDIAIVSAGNGITVDAAGANAAPSTARAADCALAETHWKSAEETKTIEVYEDHLKRFAHCPFAGLARARIEALQRK
jgi:tetratricopeptide (TPR) repeat protein